MEYEEPKFFHVMGYVDAAAHEDVIDMVSGNPDWEPPQALRDGLAAYSTFDSDEFQYPPSDGTAELKAEIGKRRGVDPDRIVVTNGTGEANYLGMGAALERGAGDEVLLSDPVYPYYPGKTRMMGATPTFVPANRDGSLDVAAYRDAISEETALVVLTTPNNPTGAVYDHEKVREIIELCEAHDALALVDEVYDHFDLSGTFESALSIDSENRIVTSGFSKSLAITGFRVGYGIFPERFAEQAKARHMLVNVATTRPGQYAVLKGLQGADAAYYEAARDLVRDRVDTFTDALDAAGAEYTRPDGAFYVMAKFDGYPGTMENVERLIDEAGVAGMPGDGFGTAYDDWLRFALVTPRVDEAADRLVEFFA
ncbi:pyridoxal phosphate-dependent aminotransferase [Halolamina sp.]|jgi:aspartate/methionine/tyrosine aminotransferase|uniref:pyridoxal phosphate-dependent aminotransferase n=1 Tax=Halolamina sp. TaxID=1940283 RepID=UPI000223BB8C|nr:Aspartate transaminase [halophilic archaeon DL31]